MTSISVQSAVLALLSSICFGSALVVGHVGLRYTSPLMGGTISITFSTVLWILLSPVFGDLSAWHLGGAIVFVIVGTFYPAAVMALTYESNRTIGPTLTGAVSSTTPVFASAAAVLFLGETLTSSVILGGLVTVTGLALLALREPVRAAPGWRLLLPLSGALLRGIAQMATKFGLLMWPSPFTAALVSYSTSTIVMWGVCSRTSNRGSGLTLTSIMWFVAVGTLNGSAVLLSYYALHHGSVAVVSTIISTYPLFTLLLSAAFLKSEKLTAKTALGVGTVIVGIITILH